MPTTYEALDKEIARLQAANAELTRQVERMRDDADAFERERLGLCAALAARDKTIELAFAALDRAHEEARKARYRSERHVCDYRTAVDAIFDITAAARAAREGMK